MKRYQVVYQWGGYSRGSGCAIIEADSPEEAKEKVMWGDDGEREVIRDDTEIETIDDVQVTEIQDEAR